MALPAAHLYRLPVAGGTLRRATVSAQLLRVLGRLPPDAPVDDEQAQPDDGKDGRDDAGHIPRMQQLVELTLLGRLPLVPDQRDRGDRDRQAPAKPKDRQCGTLGHQPAGKKERTVSKCPKQHEQKTPNKPSTKPGLPRVVQRVADRNVPIHRDRDQIPDRHAARNDQHEEAQQTEVLLAPEIDAHVEGEMVRQRQPDEDVRALQILPAITYVISNYFIETQGWKL